MVFFERWSTTDQQLPLFFFFTLRKAKNVRSRHSLSFRQGKIADTSLVVHWSRWVWQWWTHVFFSFLFFLSSESILVDRRDECGRCESWQDHFNFLYNDTSITIITFNLMVVISPTIKQMAASKWERHGVAHDHYLTWHIRF